MSNSAINQSVFSAKIGSVQNQADTSAVYSNGVWSFKNSTALTSVTITDAGAVGVLATSPRGVLDLNTTREAKIYLGTAGVIGETQSNAGDYIANNLFVSAETAGTMTYTKTTGDSGNAIVQDFSRGIAFYSGVTGAASSTGTLNSFERMRIDSSGNVGIGTSSPAAPLDVVASNTSALHLRLRGRASDSIGQMEFWNYANSTRYAYIGADSTSATFSTNGALPLLFGTSATERMRIDAHGNLLVGATSYSAGGIGPLVVIGQTSQTAGLNLQRNGSSACYIYTYNEAGFRVETTSSQAVIQMVAGGSNGVTMASGATGWSPISSDERKKKNFETTQGLSEVLQIEPVKYHFNSEEDSAAKRLGFKAQNLQAVIPEMVHPTGEKAEDGSDYLTITPDYILPVLVKAIQEQQAQIEALRTEVAALKAP